MEKKRNMMDYMKKLPNSVAPKDSTHTGQKDERKISNRGN
jgi:hypothetical protein